MSDYETVRIGSVANILLRVCGVPMVTGCTLELDISTEG